MRGVLTAIAALCVVVGLYWVLTRSDHAQDEVIRLEREGAINEAIDNDDDIPWRDRLRDAAE